MAPGVVRVLMVLATPIGGLGAVVYAVLWLALPAGQGPPAARRSRRGAVRSGAGGALLGVAGLITIREAGLWPGDIVVVAPLLAAVGATLLWRQLAPSRPPGTRPTVPAGAGTSADGSNAATVAASPPARPAAGAGAPGSTGAPGALALYRGGFGVALVAGAVLLVLQATGSLGPVRDVVLGTVIIGTGLALILAPVLWNLGRRITDERAARLRAQERAEVAAHLHDSVLQTLALVQKRAADPTAVALLARRQERELRDWLQGRVARDAAARLGDALDAVAAEAEDHHGARVDVVRVGDADLDERLRALVSAAREAVANAARFGGGAVSVYAEVEDDLVTVFVRDRGPGFEPERVPVDRRGVRESIIGRMERNGGAAQVRSGPEGTEVELTMPRAGAR
ncbi:MAG: hypothetical protein RJQ03_10985 [Miltoncostaeaceae bacterium]